MEKSCMLIQFSPWAKKMLRRHFFVRVNKQISKKYVLFYYQVLKMERKFALFSMVLLNNKKLSHCTKHYQECVSHCCMPTSGLWLAEAGQLASPEFDILLILRAQIELTLYSGCTQDSFLETFTR